SLIDSLKVTLTSAPKNPTSAAQNTMPARSSCPNRIKRSRVSSDRGTRANSRACKCIFRLGPVSVPSGRLCILAAHRSAAAEQDSDESRQIPTDFLAFQVASREPLVHSMPESTRDLHLTFASLCARRARRARHVPGNPGVPSWQAPSGVRERAQWAGGEERRAQGQVARGTDQARPWARGPDSGLQQCRAALESQLLLELPLALGRRHPGRSGEEARQ